MLLFSRFWGRQRQTLIKFHHLSMTFKCRFVPFIRQSAHEIWLWVTLLVDADHPQPASHGMKEKHLFDCFCWKHLEAYFYFYLAGCRKLNKRSKAKHAHLSALEAPQNDAKRWKQKQIKNESGSQEMEKQ